MHCNLAKLVCEADLQCNAKWEVFVAECEAEAAQGQCSTRCASHLIETTNTLVGGSLVNCTCTQRSDQLCDNLRDTVLRACLPKDNGHSPELETNLVNGEHQHPIQMSPDEHQPPIQLSPGVNLPLNRLSAIAVPLILRWTLC